MQRYYTPTPQPKNKVSLVKNILGITFIILIIWIFYIEA